MTNLGSILISGAIIFTGTVVVCLSALAIGTAIGKALFKAREAKFERVVAETPDEVFLDATRKYEGA